MTRRATLLPTPVSLLRCFQDGELGDAERQKFALFTGSQSSWKSIKQSPKTLTQMILDTPKEDYLLSTFRVWRGAMSNTQVVQRMFLYV